MSKIEWCDKTWSPITGCSPISEGCKNCYAKRMAHRLSKNPSVKNRERYDDFKVNFWPERLSQPGSWKKPQKIFVCSMGDLFHEDVPFEKIIGIFGRMATLKHHTFMLLTKRPERMLDFCCNTGLMPSVYAPNCAGTPSGEIWPENVWAGVTTENQKTADERIPILLQIPAAVRFVSVEPMLEKIDLTRIKSWHPQHGPGGSNALSGGSWKHPHVLHMAGPDSPGYCNHSDAPTIDWVICGAETGPGKRPMNTGWAYDLQKQCKDAGVPFFFKKDSNGEFPECMTREFPES